MVEWRSGVAVAMRMAMLGSVAMATVGAAGVPSTPETRIVAVSGPAASDAVAAPAPVWSADNAKLLLAVIEDASAEGLRPSDYGVATLRQAMARGPGQALDGAAQAAALALAHDYFLGRVADRESMDWHIARPEGDLMLPGALRQALAAGKVDTFFQSLLPAGERYRALRAALAESTDGAERDRIRVNMERWRWMPRTMGDDYLYVNVPSYQLQLVDGGAIRSTYTVVVGAPDTPTPQLASTAPSLVVNPWWNVPQSIVRKSNLRPGRAGFIFASSGGVMTVRQPPGPRNALGKLKINLTDTPAIYLHDTDAKAGFSRDVRDLSHGCVRVKNIDQLAGELMRDGGDGSQFEAAYAGRQTQTVRLPKTWDVYLVYFTMDKDADGRLIQYGDPYRHDAAVLARLNGSAMPALRIAMK